MVSDREAHLDRLRQADEVASEAEKNFIHYMSLYGDQYYPREGFDLDEYLRLMRHAESTANDYAELRYDVQ